PPGGELRRAHQCRRELQLVLRAEMRVNGLRRLRIPPQKESVAPGYGFCRNSHFRSPRLRQPFPSASAVSPQPAAGSRCCAWRRHGKEKRPTAGRQAQDKNARPVSGNTTTTATQQVQATRTNLVSNLQRKQYS